MFFSSQVSVHAQLALEPHGRCQETPLKLRLRSVARIGIGMAEQSVGFRISEGRMKRYDGNVSGHITHNVAQMNFIKASLLRHSV